MNTSLLSISAISLLSTSVAAVDLDNSTSIDITRVWAQQPGGWTYPMSISVPEGPVPPGGFTTCILLHGNGGQGPSTVQDFRGLLDCHILVAPTGFANSWNICSEASDAPDVSMVDELITRLQQFDNVNGDRIQIVGVSNGSALANQVLIENDNPGLTDIVGCVSPLSHSQHREGLFWRPAGATNPSLVQCGYTTPNQPGTGRRYLGISNVNDGLIPYNGGFSPVGVEFLPAQFSIWEIARSQGYAGAPIIGDGTDLGGGIFEYAYLGGDVVHLRGFANHGINPAQRAYLAEFLDGCVDVVECEGDTNGDFLIDVTDVLEILGNWGTDEPTCDLDGSGTVEVNDILILLSRFGQAC